MNDFLQTLRGNHAEKQRTPMTRKSYDAAFYNTGNHYQYTTRSTPSFPHPNRVSAEAPTEQQICDAIGVLNDHIHVLAENQKYMVDAQERTADMLERQVIALERLLDHLDIVTE